MPRARAFRKTVEMPARFSTATAITSTPRVIQFSTSSFCRAASREAGPSQINSTPNSRAASSAPTRQLTKYGSPLAFGIMAMTGALPAGSRSRRAGCSRHHRSHEPHIRRGDEQRPAEDRCTQHRNLTVLHGPFLSCSDCNRRRPGASYSINPDGRNQQRPGQHANKLRRQRRESESVLEHGNRKQADDRPGDRAASAEYRGAAQHHGRHGVQLVTSSRVGARLPDVGDIDDARETGDDARQQIREADASHNGNPRVSRSGLPVPNRVPRPADDRSMKQHAVGGDGDDQDRELSRNPAGQVALAKREKSRRKPRVVHCRLGDAFRDSAKQRQGAQRHDQRRNSEPGDQRGIQRTANHADRAAPPQRRQASRVPTRDSPCRIPLP